MHPDVSMVKKREVTNKMQKNIHEKGLRDPSEDGLRHVMTEEEVLQPYERALQYSGSHTIQLRSDHPLPPFVSREAELVTESQFPMVDDDPKGLGLEGQMRPRDQRAGMFDGEKVAFFGTKVFLNPDLFLGNLLKPSLTGIVIYSSLALLRSFLQ